MEFTWLQSLVMGLVSGLTDLLPVSSQAHQTLLLTFFGATEIDPVLRLVIHAATFLTVLAACWGRIGRIRRQLRLLRLPKRRRTRVVDMAPVMDVKVLKTALLPILALVLLQGVAGRISMNLPLLALVCFVNAALLYLPGLFPTADKDSRLVTPAESFLMGLGTGCGVVPGLSSVGISYSVGILHGVDRRYMVHLALMMHMIVTAGLMVFDVLEIMNLPVVAFGPRALIGYGAAAAAAVLGSVIAIRMVRTAAARNGLTLFSFYSFGLALLIFILYLIV